MTLLTGGQIADKLMQHARYAENITLLSAYLSKGVLPLLSSTTEFNQSIKLYIRGDKSDFLQGASDFSVLKELHQQGINCYIVKRLHAKLYIFNNKTAFIGSANLTHNGLATTKQSNLELMTEIYLKDEDLELLQRMLQFAVKLDDSLLEAMVLELDSSDKQKILNSISNDWVCMPNIVALNGLFIDNFPMCDPLDFDKNSIEFANDKEYFGLGSSLEEMRQIFVKTDIYHFLFDYLQQKESSYFGELTQYIHSNLLDDFCQRRVEVKSRLAFLFSYINYLQLDHIGTDTPNYSQRLYLKN